MSAREGGGRPRRCQPPQQGWLRDFCDDEPCGGESACSRPNDGSIGILSSFFSQSLREEAEVAHHHRCWRGRAEAGRDDVDHLS
uniref:Uncharacterized protein n=1 Tax=Oryza glumipatula TaxID=40148 RepID=A0A0E0AL21_9ORYZ